MKKVLYSRGKNGRNDLKRNKKNNNLHYDEVWGDVSRPPHGIFEGVWVSGWGWELTKYHESNKIPE